MDITSPDEVEDEAEVQPTFEKLILALDSILFHATGITLAVDESERGELDPKVRRRLKAAARRIFDEADVLMTWATEASEPGPLN